VSNRDEPGKPPHQPDLRGWVRRSKKMLVLLVSEDMQVLVANDERAVLTDFTNGLNQPSPPFIGPAQAPFIYPAA